MHLSRLSIAEMLSLSQTFLDPAHPAHQALAGAPEVTSLMPRLREINQVLLASQSADELRAGSLQKEVSSLDAEHDDPCGRESRLLAGGLPNDREPHSTLLGQER